MHDRARSHSGGVTVYTSTQAQFMTRDEVAKALGLPSNKVRCVAMTVGGGFGAKYVVIEPFVASLVKKTNRPVHLHTRAAKTSSPRTRRRTP